MRIGVDLVEIGRIETLAENPAFLQRVYSDAELQLVQGVSKQRKAEILAGRFAVKEAVAKAFGTGISNGITLRDIQTLREANGQPIVLLQGIARDTADALGVTAIQVSLSHAGGLAVAYVLCECESSRK